MLVVASRAEIAFQILYAGTQVALAATTQIAKNAFIHRVFCAKLSLLLLAVYGIYRVVNDYKPIALPQVISKFSLENCLSGLHLTAKLALVIGAVDALLQRILPKQPQLVAPQQAQPIIVHANQQPASNASSASVASAPVASAQVASVPPQVVIYNHAGGLSSSTASGQIEELQQLVVTGALDNAARGTAPDDDMVREYYAPAASSAKAAPPILPKMSLSEELAALLDSDAVQYTNPKKDSIEKYLSRAAQKRDENLKLVTDHCSAIKYYDQENIKLSKIILILTQRLAQYAQIQPTVRKLPKIDIEFEGPNYQSPTTTPIETELQELNQTVINGVTSQTSQQQMLTRMKFHRNKLYLLAAKASQITSKTCSEYARLKARVEELQKAFKAAEDALKKLKLPTSAL